MLFLRLKLHKNLWGRHLTITLPLYCLTVYDKDIAPANGVSVSPVDVLDYIDKMPSTGVRLRIGYEALAIPDDNCDMTSDAIQNSTYLSVRSHRKSSYAYKSVITAPCFAQFDLGGHANSLKAPFAANGSFIYTDLLVIHYHWQCFAVVQRLNRNVIIGHGYISPGDNNATVVQKLEHFFSLSILSSKMKKISNN